MRLPPSEIELFRAVRKYAAVLLLMLRLDTPTGESELAQILGMHSETVRTHLRGLSKAGFVARSGRFGSWILTGSGRQLILPVGKPAFPEGERGKSALALPESALERGKSALVLPSNYESERGKSALNIKNPSESAFERGKSALTLLRRRRETLKGSIKDSSSRATSENPCSPDVAAMLEASGELFGETITGSPERYSRDPWRLLAWIAQAHDKRRALNYPARVVYKALESGREPEAQYVRNPLSYLPAWFAVAVGLREALEEDEEELVSDVEVPPVSVEDSLNVDSEALHWWQSVKIALQMEIPINAWRSYVDPARLVGSSPGELVIGAPNEFCRDWLDQRLKSMIVRLLSGTADRSMDVRFVVSS